MDGDTKDLPLLSEQPDDTEALGNPAGKKRRSRSDNDSRAGSGEVCTGLGVLLGLAVLGLSIALGVTWTKKLPCDSSSAKSSSSAAVPDEWLRVAMMSDVHLDIQYLNTASALVTRNSFPCHNASEPAPFSALFGRVRCDSPPALLSNALDSMATAEKSDLLLSTGDKTAHFLYTTPTGINYNGTLVLKAQIAFTNIVKQKFPKKRVLLTMGNNDVPLHWQLPESDWYQKLWKVWSPLILCRECTPGRYGDSVNEAEFNTTFLRGGFYKVQVSSGLDFVVLSTLYWTIKAWSETPWRAENVAIANEQMSWLHDRLSDAQQNGRKVVVIGHVGPGIDPHRQKPDSNVTQFWQDNFTNTYIQHLTTFRQVVAGQIFAHLHKDEFRLLPANTPGGSSAYLPILLMPAITPIYANNPAFRYVYFEPKQWILTDYTQYWADLVKGNVASSLTWRKDYRFSEAYPSSEATITGSRLTALWQAIISNSSMWTTFMTHRQIRFANDFAPYSRYHLYCAARAPNLTVYAACRKTYPYDPAS